MQIDTRTLPIAAQRALKAAHAKQDAGHPFRAKVSAAVDAVMGSTIVTFQNPLPKLEPSPDDARDYPFQWSGRPPLNDMDLNSYFTPVKDQGSEGACTAFATVGSCESIAKRGGQVLDLSEQGNYAMSRDYDKLGPADNGASLRTALKCAQKYGLASEAAYPYDPDVVGNLTLPQAVMDDAELRKMGPYYRIDPLNFYDPTRRTRLICAALADGCPVVCASWVMQWLRELTGPIETHPGQRNADNTYMIGAHAFIINGRKEVPTLAEPIYKCRNSWSPGYGDAGRFGLLESDLDSAFEFWVPKSFMGTDITPAPYDVNSPEAQMARLYRGALGRYPDTAGLAYWTATVQQTSMLACANGFVTSPEYAGRYGNTSDAQFVVLLYQNVLYRTPAQIEIDYHVGTLQAGATRAQVLLAFTESAENKAAP